MYLTLLIQIQYSGSQGNETETARSFHYTDGLGSVIASLASNGTVIKKYTYSPFGLNGANNDHSEQPWGYTGQRYDEDSGLYYYKARYYHASLGRFLSADPVGYDDQMNLYAYVANSPLLYRDPSGRVLEAAKNGASEGFSLVKEKGPSVLRSTAKQVRSTYDSIPILGDVYRTFDPLEDVADSIESYTRGDYRGASLAAAGIFIKPAKIARLKGKRLKSSDDALQQLEEIENAQRQVRKGKSGQIIDNIEKSQQRAKHQLDRIDLEDLDGF